MTAEHVMVGNTVHLYNAKAPFVRSGKSIAGALEYDMDEDKVRCHECGGWFASVGKHAFHAHGLNRTAYKEKHGFPHSASLESEGVRKRRILAKAVVRSKLLAQLAIARKSKKRLNRKKTRTAEYANKHGRCYAQLLKKIRKLGSILKRAPTEQELRDRLHVSPSTIRWKFGSTANAMYLAGLIPNKKYVAVNPHGSPQLYSDDELLEFLKVFHSQWHRLPVDSDQKRGLLPSRSTYLMRFGTWRKAVKRAGLKPTNRYELRSLRISEAKGKAA